MAESTNETQTDECPKVIRIDDIDKIIQSWEFIGKCILISNQNESNFYFDLMNINKSLIRCLVFPPLITKYRSMIKKDCIYKIFNINIQMANTKLNNLGNVYEVHVTKDTCLKEDIDDKTTYPEITKVFTDIKDIDIFCLNKSIDVVGKISNIGPIKIVAKGTKKTAAKDVGT